MTRKLYSDEALTQAVARSKSVMGVLRHLGIRITGGSHAHISRRIKHMGLDTAHFTGQAHLRGGHSSNRKSAAEILILRADGRRQHAHQLVRALLELGIPHSCNQCGLTLWCDKPITLQVDHIDGNWLDDRQENLRFLCPNCHSQTPNFGRKPS